MMRVTAALAVAGTAAAISLHPMEKGGPGPDVTRLEGMPVTHLRTINANGSVGLFNASERAGEDAEVIAREALLSQGLGYDWEVVSNYATKRTGVKHITLRQKVGGLECSNCLATCNVDKRGRVINLAFSSHLGRVPSLTPTVSPEKALATVLDLWGAEMPAGTHATTKSASHATFPAAPGLSPDAVTADLKVLATGKAEAQLTWRVYIETEDPWYHMYEAWVQAAPGPGAFGQEEPEVLRVTDMVNWDNWDTPDPNRVERPGGALRGPARQQRGLKSVRATDQANVTKRDSGIYEVYTIPILDPGMGDGQRNLYTFGDEPLERETSPLGWHSQGEDNDFTTTVGNNVCAQENQQNSALRSCDDSIGFRPDGGVGLDFRYEFDQTADPTTNPTLSAAVTNLFFWHNIVHDIFYLNGFDEPAGNFQENNMGRGGLGDDSVQANAQDGAGFNNANFATPVDGSRPRCRMYLWNAFTPFKDGDFESGIIIHEIGHGISNRLTGGPNVVGCLSGGQSGGMGEGWSDWWAIALQQQEQFVPSDVFPMGDYVVAGGIRVYPYTFDMEINPTTFDYLSDPRFTGVHAIGSVWCQMLHDVFWIMRSEFGFSSDWYEGAAGRDLAGNHVLWQNVLDGNKLQPCSPTFVDARDAILLADEQNYEGRHLCALWCGFARRGLGLFATTSGPGDRAPVEDFSAPPECLCEEMIRKVNINATLVH